MATSYKKTLIESFPTLRENATPDNEYWNRLEPPITRKDHGAVSCINFSPTQPHQYAVTCSTKVQIFSPNTNQPVKNFTRFKDVAYCGTFRDDGQLLVAGGEEGQIRLFDVTTKSMLRVFKAHTSAVRLSKFTTDKLRVISGSDDRTLKLWDVAAENVVHTFEDHQDYIRCGATSKASHDMVLAGCYDHQAYMYDVRQQKRVLSVDHGGPIEDVLIFPSGGIFFTAGGLSIKAWDALSGGKLLATFGQHHKTITSLSFCSNYQRLASGSLDRHVKIYDTATYKPVHSLDFPSAILSVAVSPDDSLVTAGMVDGLLSIQKRGGQKKTLQEKKAEKKRAKASYHYKIHQSYTPNQEDHVIEHKRREHLEKYDKYFKKFEYSKALDAALDMRISMQHPEVAISVINELIRREGLMISLAGREPKSVKGILRFIQKHIRNAKYSPTLLDLADAILELYADRVGQWPELDQVLLSVKATVDNEADHMQQLMEVLGTMDTLFASSQASIS
ncbi:hypothetical protein CAPTEDRAFT_172738 [Capitella teleta]|uniref:U3 small nucleolar RNA-associated protein 15 homolog n=1 Tax=Capitella teleta TaxID=283909 RepID=R7VCK0_CAPTE|nr:hypothetical protein CAPTEDRAFT_172738 [Capitella teleta]|eukprot:ELU13410.1 hypothetical protein CAPTEDRAFT_172738 [Capitella teleta]